MQFSIATNFQEDLIPRLNKKSIHEVYGKLTTDFVGGCLASYMLPAVNQNKLRRHINQIHAHGLEFNYLLNSVCLGGRESSISGQRKLHRLLAWIVDIGVDSVTVSTPYLLQLIKKEYPRLKVSVSISAEVNNILKAKHWEDIGADTINLDLSIYWDFDLLRKVRKYIKCKLQVLANSSCLRHCPSRFYHFAMNAHASQQDDACKGSIIDYCFLSCTYLRLLDAVNFIRAGWIRPEDVHYYEEVGIDFLKLEDRTAFTEDMCRIVDAYTNRHYDGNFLSLTMSKKSLCRNKNKLFRGIKYFFRPFRLNLPIVYKASKLLPRLEAYIDNRSLDGFLEYFVKDKCRDQSCEECGYCAEWAKKAVRIDKDYRDRMLVQYREILDDLTSKRMSRFI